MLTGEFTLQAHLDDAIHGVLVGQPMVGLCNPLGDKLRKGVVGVLRVDTLVAIPGENTTVQDLSNDAVTHRCIGLTATPLRRRTWLLTEKAWTRRGRVSPSVTS